MLKQFLHDHRFSIRLFLLWSGLLALSFLSVALRIGDRFISIEQDYHGVFVELGKDQLQHANMIDAYSLEPFIYTNLERASGPKYIPPGYANENFSQLRHLYYKVLPMREQTSGTFTGLGFTVLFAHDRTVKNPHGSLPWVIAPVEWGAAVQVPPRVRCFGFIIPIWLPFACFAVHWYRWVRKREIEGLMRQQWRCIKCGYDLRGTPQRCPECGTVTESSPFSR